MMIKKNRLFYSVKTLLLLFLLASCTSADREQFDKELAFTEYVTARDLNTSLSLTFPTGGQNIKEPIAKLPEDELAEQEIEGLLAVQNFGGEIVIENNAEEEICLLEDFGFRIFHFTKNDNQWAELQTEILYLLSESEIVILPGEFIIVPIQKILTEDEKPILIRILVEGTFCESREPAAAFIDVEFAP